MTNEILDSNCEWICPYNYDCKNCKNERLDLSSQSYNNYSL